MYEIELKAHVYNRDLVISSLNEFATYICKRSKKDTYWSLYKEDGSKVSVRIRKESVLKDSVYFSENTFTYKKKEKKVADSQGNQIEVNDENEISLSDEDSLVLEKLFSDIGTVHLRKTKEVENWVYETNSGMANIELCTVDPLGDFLEIEIISSENDAATVQNIQNEIKKIFTRCQIDLNCIENRYYSELLKNVLYLQNK